MKTKRTRYGGRQPLSAGGPAVYQAVRLTRESVADLAAMSEETGRNRAEIIRAAVSQYVNRWKGAQARKKKTTTPRPA